MSTMAVDVKLATEQMSRLRLHSTLLGVDKMAASSVRGALATLVPLQVESVPGFVVAVLNGEHTDAAALVAWRDVIACGIEVEIKGSYATQRMSLASFCVMNRRMDLLREVVKTCDLTMVPAEMRPANRSQLLDLLCTTKAERDHPSFAGLDGSYGLAGLAAEHPNLGAFADEAMEFAWELNPEHDGFVELAEEASPEGSFVRSFLMRRGIAAADAAHAARASAEQAEAPREGADEGAHGAPRKQKPSRAI